jgi:hypothetical protein
MHGCPRRARDTQGRGGPATCSRTPSPCSRPATSTTPPLSALAQLEAWSVSYMDKIGLNSRPCCAWQSGPLRSAGTAQGAQFSAALTIIPSLSLSHLLGLTASPLPTTEISTRAVWTPRPACPDECPKCRSERPQRRPPSPPQVSAAGPPGVRTPGQPGGGGHR